MKIESLPSRPTLNPCPECGGPAAIFHHDRSSDPTGHYFSVCCRWCTHEGSIWWTDPNGYDWDTHLQEMAARNAWNLEESTIP